MLQRDKEFAKIIVWLRANKMTAHTDIKGVTTLRKK